jgi:hypothetical protein
MRQVLVIALAGLSIVGCRLAPVPQRPLVYENPVRVRAPNVDYLWDELVAVVDDYFDIDREERPKRIGDVITAGRIITFPQGGATALEPWRGDAANPYERLEGTLQSIRRRAIVQVIPVDDSYLVDVTVYKELEDVPRPEFSPSGAAGFRVDDSLPGIVEPAGATIAPLGWIAQGRDCSLEQKIIAQLVDQLNKPRDVGHRAAK